MLAGYSFTSPAVVKALMDAKRRGVDVKVLVDDKGNRGASSLAAMRLIDGARECRTSIFATNSKIVKWQAAGSACRRAAPPQS